MIVRKILIQRSPQAAFSDEDQMGETFLFDGSYPPFRKGVQVRAAGGNAQLLSPYGRLNSPAENLDSTRLHHEYFMAPVIA